MLSAEATVTTESSGRYLAQLVKHFAHKLPTTLAADNSTGRIDFGMGPCDLAIRDGALHMRVEGATPEDLNRLQDVVARHLLRFAFREPPVIAWVQARGHATLLP